MLILYLLKNMILGPVITLQETNQREESSEHSSTQVAGILGAPQLWKVETSLPLQQPCLRFAQLWLFLGFVEPKFVNITKQFFLHEHGGLFQLISLFSSYVEQRAKDSANPTGGYGKENWWCFLRFASKPGGGSLAPFYEERLDTLSSWGLPSKTPASSAENEQMSPKRELFQ